MVETLKTLPKSGPLTLVEILFKFSFQKLNHDNFSVYVYLSIAQRMIIMFLVFILTS